MASATAPSTPQQATPSPLMRRSFTLPLKSPELQKPKTFGRGSQADEVNTLFAYHTSKILSFSVASSSSRPSSSSGRGRDGAISEPIGTIPWASKTDKFLATGPIHIHRVQDTVAFLHAGKVIQTIFPSSKCWCVDGETKFVLRIRENNYYRIELPNTCAEDLQMAEELKQVFSKISQFELTPCPFKRGFTVDLPETPKTPIQKRPWKPRNHSSSLSGGITFTSRKRAESSSDKSSRNSTDEDCISQCSEDATEARSAVENRNRTDLEPIESPTRPKAFCGARAVTAPPQLILREAAPSDLIASTMKRQADEAETLSLSSSVDSFHSFTSFHSPLSPLPPSPPYSDPPSPSQRASCDLGIDIRRVRQHKRDTSELTVTAESFPPLDSAETPTWHQDEDPLTPMRPRTPALTNDAASQDDDFWSEAKTPSPSTALDRHSIPIRRRAHSPLPSSANLYSPRTRMTGHHSTSSILLQTCSLLLGPPVQLVALMLNIAARIRNGTFGRSSSGERDRPMPCTWDYHDVDDEARDLWEEDDYGISLGILPTSKLKTAREVGKSWEID